jgi:hypothetical protein
MPTPARPSRLSLRSVTPDRGRRRIAVDAGAGDVRPVSVALRLAGEGAAVAWRSTALPPQVHPKAGEGGLVGGSFCGGPEGGSPLRLL